MSPTSACGLEREGEEFVEGGFQYVPAVQTELLQLPFGVQVEYVAEDDVNSCVAPFQVLARAVAAGLRALLRGQEVREVLESRLSAERSSIDEIVDLYKRDVDRTLIRENLKLTPEQRLRKLMELQQVAEELRRAGRRAAR